MRKRIPYILLSATSIFITLVVVEIALRLLSSITPDGNRILFSRQLSPCKLPIMRIGEIIIKHDEHINDSPPSILARYDSLLGYKPNALYDSDRYTYNIQGIRVGKEEINSLIDTVRRPKCIRIALFGDSFTHCDEVTFEESWGYQLEVLLNNSGLNTEVLNFGVFGYGMDQAYLRWGVEGKIFEPDIVIFGFSTADIKRNLIAAKGISKERGIPFTKPRFIIDGGGNLQLVNSPTVPPNKILLNVKELDDFPFIQYNYNYREVKEKFETRWYRHSVLCSFIEDIFQNNRYMELRQQRALYDFSEEPATLCLKIIDNFGSSVQASGSEFIVVDLPKYLNIMNYIDNDSSLPYEALLDSIQRQSHLVPTIEQFEMYYTGHENEDLLEVGDDSSFFATNGHYTSKGNSVVAASLYEYITSGELKTLWQ